jgi:hypothetical protein
MNLWTALSVKEAISRIENALRADNSPETTESLKRSLLELKSIK